MEFSKPGGILVAERRFGVDSSLSKLSNHSSSSNASPVCWASLLPNPLLVVYEESDEVSSADGIEVKC